MYVCKQSKPVYLIRAMIAGELFFNIATIKGKSDNKTYNVGLLCVKKIL